MSAKFLYRLRSIIIFGGVLLGVTAAILVGVWETQSGKRLDIPFLEGGETEGVKAEPIPTPAAVGVGISTIAIGLWVILGWIPCKCPLCGALAIYPKREARRLSLYSCGKCNEVDPDPPAVRSAKHRSASSGY
jgi:hypothetical protein